MIRSHRINSKNFLLVYGEKFLDLYNVTYHLLVFCILSREDASDIVVHPCTCRFSIHSAKSA